MRRDNSTKELALKQANFCSLFGNTRRVLILWTLMDKEMSVGAIAEAVGSSLQNVSQHLSKLKDYNLVSFRREGQTIYYRVDEDALANQCLGLLRSNPSHSSVQIRKGVKT